MRGFLVNDDYTVVMGELRGYSREELLSIDPALLEFEAALTQVVAQIEVFERQEREGRVVVEPVVVEPVISQVQVRLPFRQAFGALTHALAQSLLGFL